MNKLAKLTLAAAALVVVVSVVARRQPDARDAPTDAREQVAGQRSDAVI